MFFKISDLDGEKRILIFFFVAALLLGYGVSVLKVMETSAGGSIEQVVLSYRGSQDPNLMAFPKPYSEMLQSTHAHALSVPLVYFLLSLLFLATRAGIMQKKVLVSLLFGTFFLEYFSLWGLRYFSESFVYLSFLAHLISGPIYIYMCGRVLYELKSCCVT